MNIIVMGDIHGNWNALNKVVEEKRPDIILQCGDFGWWPKFHGQKWNQYGINNGNTKIYFCPGNHEDWKNLNRKWSGEKNEVMSNIFYMKRGAVLTLPDKRNVLFMGGANSVDRHLRLEGWDWFREELITQKDLDNLPDTHIDIVISHTAPKKFDINIPYCEDKERDPCRFALDIVFEKYNPSLWYFGHWHDTKEGIYNGCKWFMLNQEEEPGWYRYLDERKTKCQSVSIANTTIGK